MTKVERVKFDTTEHGLTHRLYHSQRSRCRRDGRSLPTYSKEELRKFIYTQPNFKKLFADWVASDYSTDLRPSIDRLNDYLPYTLTNIRLVTWEENNAKGRLDRREGRNNKVNKAIHQCDLSGKVIQSFHSLNEASRVTKVSVANISKAANGKRKTAGKSTWRYTDGN